MIAPYTYLMEWECRRVAPDINITQSIQMYVIKWSSTYIGMQLHLRNWYLEKEKLFIAFRSGWISAGPEQLHLKVPIKCLRIAKNGNYHCECGQWVDWQFLFATTSVATSWYSQTGDTNKNKTKCLAFSIGWGWNRRDPLCNWAHLGAPLKNCIAK